MGALDLLGFPVLGIGSICGEYPTAAAHTIRWLGRQLAGVKYHAFGLHVQALDDDRAYWHVVSWDSYSWNWGRGQKDVDRPQECYHREGETWSVYTRRLAEFYFAETVRPRLVQPHQMAMW